MGGSHAATKMSEGNKIQEICGLWIDSFSSSTMACPFVHHLILSLLIIISHASHAKPEKVDLSLYYESLCPYCSSFITNQLAQQLFNSDLINIVNLRLVPWGNAQFLQANNTIVCQHGEDECYLNAIHACAIDIWPDPKEHFRFIECVEGGGNGGHEEQEHSAGADAVWKACSQSLGFSQKLIYKCYATGYGRKLSLQYAAQTNHLNPQHRFVPWVTVNGQPLYDDYKNFAAYVCKAYKGKPTAKACLSKSHEAYKEETPRKNFQLQQRLDGCKA